MSRNLLHDSIYLCFMELGFYKPIDITPKTNRFCLEKNKCIGLITIIIGLYFVMSFCSVVVRNFHIFPSKTYILFVSRLVVADLKVETENQNLRLG